MRVAPLFRFFCAAAGAQPASFEGNVYGAISQRDGAGSPYHAEGRPGVGPTICAGASQRAALTILRRDTAPGL